MFKKRLAIVESINVVSPCQAEDFDREAVRVDDGWYCEHCDERVYDLAAMTKREIAELIDRTDGKFCASVRRRSDGSLVTGDVTSPTRSFISAGALLASTALVSGVALAESEETIGKIAVTDSETPVAPVPLPTEAPQPSPDSHASCDDKEQGVTEKPSAQATAAATPRPHALRGKVKVDR